MSEPTSVSGRSWNDMRIEVIIGTLLRSGVILAASVVLVGGILYLVRHGHELPDYGTFHGEPGMLKSLGGIFHGVAALSARAMIQLGLLLLIATPVARVVFSAIAFALERDYLYVVITLIVLGVLAYSLFGGG